MRMRMRRRYIKIFIRHDEFFFGSHDEFFFGKFTWSRESDCLIVRERHTTQIL